MMEIKKQLRKEILKSRMDLFLEPKRYMPIRVVIAMVPKAALVDVNRTARPRAMMIIIFRIVLFLKVQELWIKRVGKKRINATVLADTI